jgi:hypothetical protein
VYPSHIQHTDQTFDVRCKVDVNTRSVGKSSVHGYATGSFGDEFMQRIHILFDGAKLIYLLGDGKYCSIVPRTARNTRTCHRGWQYLSCSGHGGTREEHLLLPIPFNSYPRVRNHVNGIL